MNVWQRFWRFLTNADEAERQERAHRQVMWMLDQARKTEEPQPDAAPSSEWRAVGDPWPTT